MSDKPQPSKNSPDSPAFTLEELEQLSRFTQKTKPTSPTPPTEVRGNELSTIPSANTAPVPTTTKNTLDTFEKLIGGREALIDHLTLLPLDKKQQHFLYLLCDGRMNHHPLSHVARVAGVTANAIMDLFSDAARHRAQALGMSQLSSNVPAVLSDIISKSYDQKVECPECFGVSIEGVPCPKCHGKGQILRQSDIDRQKLVLEMTGMVKKGPATAVQINNNVGNSIQSGTFFSKWVKDSDSAAYDVVLDAETIEKDEK